MTEAEIIEGPVNLFGEVYKPIPQVRTIGFYQPFCSLMLHGKLETRWVQEGKKPPFPKGEYLMYSTKVPTANYQLFNWCGPEIMLMMSETLKEEETKILNGYAIASGTLVNLRHMTKEDERKAFVKYVGTREMLNEVSNKWYVQRQWVLEFTNIRRVCPMPYSWGKQGIGFLPNELQDWYNKDIQSKRSFATEETTGN